MANGYSAAEARSRLESTAEDIGFRDNTQESGLINVEAAVDSSSTDPFNIETRTATDVTGTSATFTAEFTALGGADSAELLFTYWKKGNKLSTRKYTDWQTVSSSSTVSEAVTGLQGGEAYVIKAIAHRTDTDE
jgi:hypothetical protein